MFALTILTLVFAGASHAADLQPRFYENYKFEHFVQEYERSYATPGEYAHRETIFNANLEFIRKQNQAYVEGRSKWVAAVTNFGDKTQNDMKPYLGLHKPSLWRKSAGSVGKQAIRASEWSQNRNGSLPESVDWRKKNVVTPPKSQGGCGDCWAFSAAEAIESHGALNTGKLLNLAPQEITSCVSNPQKCGGIGGCEGAIVELAFDYAKAKGLALEAAYPYKGKDGSCHQAQPAAYVDGFEELPKNDGDALASAVATKGPIAISAAAKMWGFYFGGIFDGHQGFEKGCPPDIDHAVQLVGYGKTSNNTDYWLVRNSWGPKFGEEGYIRVLRSPGNEPCAVDPTPKDGICGDGPMCECPSPVTYCGMCGILAASSYPTGARLA